MEIVMDWKIGDIVQCRTGGPNMVVKDTGKDGILCEWIDDRKRYQSGTFAATSLEIPWRHGPETI
jgi:uncharacterized protein YodC (DUF2158 family)